MTDAEIVRMVLEAAIREGGADRALIAEGTLAVECDVVDREALPDVLARLGTDRGWITTTDAVSRGSGQDASIVATEHRILSADFHRGDADVTTVIRSHGDRYQVRTIRPQAGPGVLVTRRLVALDGGWLRYQTAWEPVDGRLVAGTTRFLGFEDDERGDRR